MKNRIFSSPFSRLPLSYLFLLFLTFFAASVASAQIPSSGLVGYWPFNGNANDESGNGNNGTVNGATLTTDRFGNANSAYSFDGVNDWIGMNFQNINTSYSLSFWYYSAAVTNGMNFLESNSSYCEPINQANIYYNQNTSGGNTSITSVGSFQSGIWSNVLISFDGINNLQSIYINGVLDAQQSVTSTLTLLNSLLLAKRPNNTGYFNGKLDDISIYNRALTPAEITQLYTDQTSTVTTPPCPTLATNLQNGLVGYWPFCGNANDESGNGNNGTVNGATLTADRFGNANSAYSFDGDNDIIDFGDVTFLDGISEATWSWWVETQEVQPQVSESEYVSVFRKDLAWIPMQFANENYDYWRGFIFQTASGSTSGNIIYTNNVSYGEWQCFTLVKSLNELSLYKNGILVQTVAFSGVLENSNSPFLLGRAYLFNNAEAFNGKIDDVSIYTRALTPVEISQNYSNASAELPITCTPFLGEDQTVCAGTSVTLSASSTSSSAGCPTLPTNLQTGLVGYWPFCGNANDASGNGNNGTVNGATLTTDRFGNANSAFEFTTNSKISCNLINTSEYSISGWVNASGFSAGGSYCSSAETIFSHKNNLNNGNGFVVGMNNSPAWTNYIGGNSSNYLSINSPAPALGTWYHISQTLDMQGNQKFYVNGLLVYSSVISGSIIPGNNYDFLFGHQIDGGTICWFNGKIDDVAYWNRALSASEVQQLFNQNPPSFLWSNGATTPTINVSPSTSTTYTCTVTTNGVSCTDSVTVVVSNPIIDLGADVTVCGTSTTLTAPSGYDSYLWSNGGTTSTTTVTANGTYSCTVTQGGCSATDSIDVTLIDATITASDSIICAGEISTLSVNAIPGSAFNSVLFPNPVEFNGHFYSKYTGTANWFDAKTICETNGGYLAIPNSVAESDFIQGVSGIDEPGTWIGLSDQAAEGTWIDVQGNPVAFFNWYPGEPNNVGDEDFVCVYNQANGLRKWNDLQPSYLLPFVMETNSMPSAILWSNGATTPTINVSPTSTTTYTCTVTTNGVSCTDSVTVLVSNPVIDLGADVTICGTSTTLTAPSGYDSYLWSNGGTTNTTTVSANGTYSCTVTQGGCSATDSIDVTLIDATITASDLIICAGEIVTLSVPQAGSTSTICAALPTNLQTGLVGYWPFCGNANDASGNGNNGSVNGAALTTDRFGSANGAYSFDGYNDLIRVPHQPNLNLLGDYSISVWLEGNFQNLFNNNWVLIAKRDDAGTCCSPNVPYDFFIPFNSTNYAVPGMAYANGGYSFATPPNNITVPLAGWQNVIITNSSDNLNFFVNGNLVYTTNFPSSLRLPNTSDLLIGSVNREFGAEWMSGKLDDIGTWSRALTAEEIQQLYTLGQTTYLWSNGATTPTINVSPTSTTTYTCTVTTNGVSCTDDITVVVSQPLASITPNGIVEICQGQSIALTANGGVSYLWNTGAQTQSITVNTEAVYTVTVTDANGCTDTESQLVKVNFLPNIGVNNASTCSGQSTTLTATGGLSYVWSPAMGLSSTTGTTVTASPSTSTVYTVTGTGANGCTNTATAAVTVNAAPTATITPATATTFCQGGSVVLNANTGTGLTYQWRLNGNPISGATSSSYTANASGSYTVVVTNTSTCSATSTATVVTVNALPTATITPATATTFCQGGSVVLTANTGTGLSYQWRLNGTNITGATSSSYTANASGSYTVIVTNTSTCSATSTATVVTVNALPTATITASSATTFCQGGSVVLTANTGTGLSYQWFNNTVAISGATSSTYTANASGSYTVIVTNTSACSATSTATVVTVNALPTATITPATATTFCQGGSVVLNANTGAGLSYQWFNNAVAISGATTSSYTANTSGSYTVVVTNTSTCSATSTATVVTVNALPIASISPNGLVEICQGQSIALTANGGVTYLWNTGAPTQSITVNTEALYTVTVTDVNGCIDTESQFVKVNQLPNIGVNNASICVGQSATLTATGGLSYVWSPATGLSATTGSTVSSSTTTNAVYTVTGTGANGCTNSATATVTVNALPTATITPATATTFCQGGSVVLNANTGAGLSYQWYNNAAIISGATFSSYTANASGSYTVVVTNTSACSSTSTATVVTVIPNVDYFADVDGDGFGDAATLLSTCVQPQGYVTDNTDCDDTSADVNTAATEVCNHIDDDCSGSIDDGLVFDTYYADVDGDTFGDANNSIYECSQPSGYVTNNTDCNDNNANQNTVSTEICNGEDDDCDGQIDNGITFLDYYADSDGDGFGAGDVISSCSDLGAGYVSNNTDCDDANGNTYPGATELCNTIDDNCDGQIDEGVQTVYFIDNDGDTYGNPSVSILACTQPIGYTPDDTDCNDTDANINPGAEDIGGNGIDENCDGQIDNSIFELNATISLYPNPTRSELNIQVNSSIIGNDLYIFDAVGKLVFKQQLLSTQTIIPVSNFADGNYVVRIGEVVKRFEVMK